MCQHHTAPGLHASERVPQYELLSCFCIIQHQDCMRAQVRAVDMRRHHTAPGPCTRNEVRKSELLACVSIIQLQACMSAQVRRQGYMRSKRVLQVQAVDMRQHHTAPGLHGHRRVLHVRDDCMCKDHTARGLHERERVPQVRAVGMRQHRTARGSKYERKYGMSACVSIMRCEGCMSASEYASTS